MKFSRIIVLALTALAVACTDGVLSGGGGSSGPINRSVTTTGADHVTSSPSAAFDARTSFTIEMFIRPGSLAANSKLFVAWQGGVPAISFGVSSTGDLSVFISTNCAGAG